MIKPVFELDYDTRTKISSHWWGLLKRCDRRFPGVKGIRRKWAMRLLGPQHRRLYGWRSVMVDRYHFDDWPLGLPLLGLELVLDLFEDAESGPGLDAYAARVEAFSAESDRILSEARELLESVAKEG